MSEVHTLASTHVPGQRYRILVALPTSYATNPSVRYPVLYTLDADLLFGTVTEFTRALPIGQELPETIVVGVGYEVESFVETIGLRARDFTPTEDPDWVERMWRQAAALPGMPPPEGTGGAPAFLSFLTEELVPFVDGRYRTIPGDRGLFGASLGGLFAVYTLFHQPEAFRRYVVGSPALWWDREVAFDHAERFLAERSELGARLFLGVGELEEGGTRADALRMVTNVERLAESLGAAELAGFHLEWEVFPHETHLSVTPVLVSRGVRSVYPVTAGGPGSGNPE